MKILIDWIKLLPLMNKSTLMCFTIALNKIKKYYEIINIILSISESILSNVYNIGAHIDYITYDKFFWLIFD